MEKKLLPNIDITMNQEKLKRMFDDEKKRLHGVIARLESSISSEQTYSNILREKLKDAENEKCLAVAESILLRMERDEFLAELCWMDFQCLK